MLQGLSIKQKSVTFKKKKRKLSFYVVEETALDTLKTLLKELKKVFCRIANIHNLRTN